MIPMPIAEIADRYSICLLKDERTDEDMTEELDFYKPELETFGPYLMDFVDRLYRANGEIWDLESDIRKGREKELGLEEVGRRAIKIRNKNRVRISIKNEIVDTFNVGFKDIKVNHGSD